MTPGEIQVWRIRLDVAEPPPPTAGESARAARFRSADMQRRYLRSHAALRSILGRETDARLDFAVSPTGKPFLPAAPHVKFNLSHSHEMALVAVALEVEIGVDVEAVRPMVDFREIADRFFPASEAAQVAGLADFFRRWTRLEAVVKATGAGLYGLGAELQGEWTIQEIDAGFGYSAAVAAPLAGMRVTICDFGVTL